jgi:hypothetical protein
MSGMHSYGDEVNRQHQNTVEILTEVPAFRLHYGSLEDGVRLVNEIS